MDSYQAFLKARREKPTRVSGGQTPAARGTEYGDAVVQPLFGGKTIGLADEGSYFVATNPTPGTGIAGIADPATFADTKALVVLKNTSETLSVYLDYLNLTVTAAGTNATNLYWVAKLDNITRWSSGGSAITPVNTNMDSTTAAAVDLRFGAAVAVAAGSSARLIGHGVVRTVIPVVADQYRFVFGGSEVAAVHSPMSTIGTAIAYAVVPVAPVVLGPGDSLLFHTFSGSQSGAHSFEFSLGFWQR